MKIGIYTAELDEESRHENELLTRHIRETGHETVLINYGHGSCVVNPNTGCLEIVSSGNRRAVTAADADVIIPRINEPAIEQVLLATMGLKALIAAGIPSINDPEAIRTAKSKIDTQWVLEREAGLRTPETLLPTAIKVASSADMLQAIEPDPEERVVLKSNHGTTGEGTIILSDRKSAKGVLDKNREPVLLQRFVKTPGYPAAVSDIRVVVVGDKTISYARRSEEDYRSNVYLADGGYVVDYSASETERQVAIVATRAIGLQLSGVDLYQPLDESGKDSTGEIIVNEVNASPGFGKGEKLERQVASAIVSLAVKTALQTKN